jgi:hypothetical protein
MNSSPDIYNKMVLRAVLGENPCEAKVANPALLRRIVDHLADSEAARAALQAKGYGRGGKSFLELAAEVPNNVHGMIKNLFAPRTLIAYPDLGEVHDNWSAR